MEHKAKNKRAVKSPKLSKKPWEATGIDRSCFFPCKADKSPDCPSWPNYSGPWGIEPPLWGLNLKKTGLLVLDDDRAKSKVSNENIKKASGFIDNVIKNQANGIIQTPSGGHHYPFKNPHKIKQTKLFGCLDIKSGFDGHGGYVCFYEDWGSIDFERLPDFDPQWIPGQIKTVPTAGSGKNNDFLNSGYSTFKHGSPEQIINQLWEIKAEFDKNPSKTSQATAKEKLIKSLKDGLKGRDPGPTPPPDFDKKRHNQGLTHKKKQSKSFLRLLDEKLKNISYLDKHNTFIRGVVSVVSGPKGSFKSTGVLSILLDEDINIMYYSDYEVRSERVQKIATALDKKKYLHWMDDFPTKKEEWETLQKEIIEKEIKAIFFDPPPLSGSTNSDTDVKKLLKPFIILAQNTNTAVLIARNYNKSEIIKKEENRVSGSYAWTAVPRATFYLYPAEIGSKLRQNKKDPECSLLACGVCNEGKRPKHVFILTIKTKNQDGIVLPYCKFDKPTTPDNIKDLYKSQIDKIKSKENRELEILEWLKTQDDQKALARDIKATLAKILKVNERTIQRDLYNLLNNKELEKVGTNNKGNFSYQIPDPEQKKYPPPDPCF